MLLNPINSDVLNVVYLKLYRCKIDKKRFYNVILIFIIIIV